ncbi:GNAT family N-acetyltransferase [Konateibacter massiliensis]|uniref:GNAT family N-acetyltransferase n=1 Tax=Konateibacter massiliensis TaxID=2002841 RepID=UPI000C149080|nr:GNAT family N-acetyltransferase [Konateibacter massiliensis]
MGQITYRLAKRDDRYLLAMLKKEVWNTTYRGIYPDEKINSYDILRNSLKFEEIINNPNINLYVAADNEQIVGYMSCGEPCRPFRNFKQEIGLLYLLKEYQRKGIGRTLFTIGKDIIKSNGNDEFFISVNKYNIDALNFYVSMGGKIIHIDEDKEDKSKVQIKLHYHV